MLNNMKISTRLVFLMTLLLVLAIVLGGVGIVGMGKTDEGLRTVYEDRTVPLMDLGLIIDMANRVRTNAVIAFSALKTEVAEKYNADTLSLDGEIDKLWTKYTATSLTSDEKRLVDESGQQWKTYQTSRNITLKLAMEGNFAASQENAIKDAGPKFTAMRETLFKLIKLQGAVAKQEYEESVSRYEMTRNIIIALILLGVVLGGALGLSIISGINRSVGELCGVR